MGTLTLVWIAAVALGQGADQSLTVDEYVDRGVPSPGRLWSSRDYKAAREVLLKIKAENPSALPRKGSPRSKALFQRIVDPMNLKTVTTDGIPLNARVGESIALLQEMPPTLFLYFEANGKRQEYDVESLDFMAYMMRVVAVTYGLVDQFYETLPEEERENPVRKKGIEQMYTGLLTSVNGLIQLLDESDQYGQENLEAYAQRLPEIMRPIWPRVKELDRKELLHKIKQQAEDNPSTKIRSAMVKLEASLKKPQPADDPDSKP